MGARVQLDFANDHVIAGFGWNDRKCVLAFAQPSGGNSERMDKIRLHLKELAQFATVHFDVPFLLHVILTNEKRAFCGIGRCLKM